MKIQIAIAAALLAILACMPRFAHAACAAAAVGDRVCDCASVAALAQLDIKPAAGVEWAIYNIVFDYTVELSQTDGATVATGPQFLGPDWQFFTPGWGVANTNWLRVKNLHATLAKGICFNGVRLK